MHDMVVGVNLCMSPLLITAKGCCKEQNPLLHPIYVVAWANTAFTSAL